MTIDEALDVGLNRQASRGVSSNTLRVYRSQCRHFRNAFGPVDTAAIDPWEVEVAMKRWPLQPKSSLQVMKVTRSLLEQSGAECPWLNRLSLPIDRTVMERDWLRPEQAISVLNTAYRMGSLKTFALQLFAGLSRAEVLPLRWKNVSSQFLRVEETMIVGTGGLEIVPRTKAPARRRIIPMSPFLQDLLRYNRGDDEDFVAANPDGSPMSTMQYEYAQKLMNRNLGFRVGHELRHTFATLLSLTGIPDTHRRQLMGHTGLGITDKVYTHQFAEAAIPYINKVEALALGDEPMPTLVPHEWL